MFNSICKLFIKNYDDVNNEDVRERYGVVFSIFGIICNVILVVFKLLVSFVTNSISIRNDALNNMSDIGSNVASLFGFRLSNKHADQDHPYGHGRYEYISGMVISFLILLMAISSISDSITKIINPDELHTSVSAFVVIIASIFIKMLMCVENRMAGKKINSETLLAASQDSFNDSLMTAGTLIGMLIYACFKINVDAYVGLILGLFVLKSGIDIFKDTMDTILGLAPSKELVEEISKTILAHDEVVGIHDMMVHDYGPSHKFMTVHCEVSSKRDILESHDIIDNIEVEINRKFGILTTIHMDPIDEDDELTNKLKKMTEDVVKNINKDYSIHDFRIVRGPSHINLIFDCVLPSDDTSSHLEVSQKIRNDISKINTNYLCVIKVEHSFV